MHIRFVSILLMLTFSFVIASSQPVKRPKIAVVLSGGGAKGFAHIGVLKVLEQEGVPIDIIVGTSIGSIVGGLYSIGYNADQIAEMALAENWSQLLLDYTPRKQLDQFSKEEQQRYVLSLPISDNGKPELPNGLVNGQNILNLFCGLTADLPDNADFSKFPISFACIGADLATGNQVILNSGFLPTAILSSMAIPGIFSPSHHNKHILIDGGIVNNFPTDVAKEMGADIIIGVDIRSDLLPAESIKSMKNLTDQLINFYTTKKDSVNKSYCNIIIRPNIEGYNASSFYTDAVDTLIQRGRESVNLVLDDIRALKLKYDLAPRIVSAELINRKAWKITDVKIKGNCTMSDKQLIDALDLELPGTFNYKTIKKHINNIYGMGGFRRVFFSLEGEDSEKTLNVTVDENRSWVMNFGVRANSRSVVSIVLNATRKDYTRNLDLISFTADVSTNPKFTFIAEFGKKRLPKFVIQTEASYRDLTVHLNKDYSYPANIYLGSLKLFTYQRIVKYSLFGVGMRQEYFVGKIYSTIGDSSLSLSTNKKLTTHLYGFYSFDNLDDYYFPSHGAESFVEMSLVQDLDFHSINPILLVKHRNAMSLSGNSTVLIGIFGRFLFRETTPVQLGNYVAPQDYELSVNYHLPFYGLPSVWAAERITIIGSLGLRLNFKHNHFITLITNGLLQNRTVEDLDQYNVILGGGITYSFRSKIGPIGLTIGYAEKYQKPVVSANVGFWF